MADEPFLSRWSRLKRKAVEPVSPPPADEPPLPVEATPDEQPPTAVAEEEADPLVDLPSIEDLTAESDYTPFLRPGVPDDLHRQALRKLWTSDPVYANDDGLKDYAADYGSLFNLDEPVKTLYRVGRGFLDKVEELEEAAGQPEEAALSPPADAESLDAPDEQAVLPPPMPILAEEQEK